MELWLYFGGNSNQEFIKNQKSIAIHCIELKKLIFVVQSSNPLLNKQIFNCLGFFKNLNYLELWLNEDNEKSDEMSCESLKGLKLLINLIVENPIMNDIFVLLRHLT